MSQELVKQHLQFIESRAHVFFTHYHEGEKNQVENFCLGLIDRERSISFTMLSMMEHMVSDTAFEVASGILLRSQLLDCLMIHKAYRIINSGVTSSPEIALQAQEELLGWCSQVLEEDQNESIRGFVKRGYDAGVIQQQEHDHLLSLYPKSTFRTSAGKIQNQFGRGDAANYIFNVISLYELYSKYDHYNGLYLKLRFNSNPKKADRILKAVQFMCHALYFVTYVLLSQRQEDTTLHEQQREIGEYVLNVAKFDNIDSPI